MAVLILSQWFLPFSSTFFAGKLFFCTHFLISPLICQSVNILCFMQAAAAHSLNLCSADLVWRVFSAAAASAAGRPNHLCLMASKFGQSLCRGEREREKTLVWCKLRSILGPPA